MQTPLKFDDLPNPFDEAQNVTPTPVDVICWLTYSSYAHNRRISPEVLAEKWETVYGPQAGRLEELYQRELAREQKERHEIPQTENIDCV
jgi:hypothetical protein